MPNRPSPEDASDLTPAFSLQSLTVCRALTRSAGFASAGIAVLGLIGWTAHRRLLAALGPAWPEMKPISAIAALLAGFALWQLAANVELADAWRRRSVRISAALSTGIGLGALCQRLPLPPIFVGHSLGRAFGSVIASRPMSLESGLGFNALGIGLLLLASRRTRRRAWVAHGVALAVAFSAVVGLCGYLFGPVTFQHTVLFAHASLASVLVLFVLSVGVACSRPKHGLMGLFNADTTGGALLRRSLVPLALIPLLLHACELIVDREGVVSDRVGLAIDTAATIFLSGIVLWRVARLLHEGDLDRRSMQAELARSEERYRQLVEMSPVPIIVKDTRRIAFANPAARQLVGARPADQLVGRSPWTFIHPDERQSFEAVIGQVVNAGATLPRLEQRLLRLDGAVLDVELSASPIEYHGRRLAQVVARDVTASKTATAALRASEARFRATFEQAGVAMAIVSLDGRFLRVNERYSAILGYPPEELCQKTFQEITHPDDLAVDLQKHQSLLHRGITTYTREKRYVRRDDSVAWVLLTVSLVQRSDGSPDHFVALVEDINERRNLEAQLRHTQKMEAVGQLAGSVAHDFNNLLTAILGHVTLTQSNPELAPAARESLDEIAKLSRRAANLTRQLLLFSRREVMQPRRLDLGETVSNLAKMLRRLLGEEVQLKLNLHPTPLFVHADAGMIDQVVMNLAVNARDAMPRGGDLTIETRWVSIDPEMARHYPDVVPGDYVSLLVKDHGSGIPPEILPRIFDPFFTTKPRDKGTGLGLATVFGIVKQHGGWLRVETELGRGTTFHVHFPPDQRATPDAPAETAAVAAAGSGKTVLLVEDEEVVRTLTIGMLERAGYRAIAATDATEALHRFSESWRSIDLLMTDLVLPGGMGGKELAAALRASKPELKTVYTTGYSRATGDLKLGPEFGNAFLQKPYEFSQLGAALAELFVATTTGGPNRQ